MININRYKLHQQKFLEVLRKFLEQKGVHKDQKVWSFPHKPHASYSLFCLCEKVDLGSPTGAHYVCEHNPSGGSGGK